MPTRKTEKKPPTKAQFQRRLKRLRSLYPLGRKVHAEIKKSIEAGKKQDKVCDRIAAEAKVHRTVVDGARQLVDLFTNKEFQDLCRVRVNGFPLSHKHIFHLVGVKDRKRRVALARRIGPEQLSDNALVLEIRKRPEKERILSGRRREPKDFRDALRHTADLAHQWVRWHKDLKECEGDPVNVTQFRRKVWNELMSVVASLADDLRNLRDAADAYLRNANAAAFVKARLEARDGPKSKSTK